MMKRLKTKDPTQDIIYFFDGLRTRVFAKSELQEILAEKQEDWRLAKSITPHRFITFLLENTKMRLVSLKFPSRNMNRYLWGEPSPYEVVASLKPQSYFTHYSAMYLHELTEQAPNTIYLNFEQPRKNQGNRDLEQANIDRAFKGRVRVSNNIGTYEDKKICLLNGMNTGRAGVIEMETSDGAVVPVTNIERTLIDITVRPVYSGGVFEVLKAFRLAKDKVSINRLTALLKQMDYIYPFHQAIGFYLERSGAYKASSINLLRKFEIKHDFYLDYQMKDKDYSKDWRLYFPKGL